MNKFFRYLACVMLSMNLSGCGWGTPVSNETNKCVPPTYPDFSIAPMRAGEPNITTTTVSVTDINQAYMDELHAVELSLSEPLNPIRKARWEMTKFPTGYLYGCVELVSNYYVEGGCIYLQPIETGTSIQRLWEYSEGLSGCVSALQIPPVTGN